MTNTTPPSVRLNCPSKTGTFSHVDIFCRDGKVWLSGTLRTTSYDSPEVITLRQYKDMATVVRIFMRQGWKLSPAC